MEKLKNCVDCKERRSAIKKEIDAFKVLVKLNPHLSSLILISNLEDLIAKEEESDRRNGKVTDDTVVVSTEPPHESEDDADAGAHYDPTSDPDWEVSLISPRRRVKTRVQKQPISKVSAAVKTSVNVIQKSCLVQKSITVRKTPVVPPPRVDNCITTSKLRSADEYIRQVNANGHMMYKCLICNRMLTLRANTRLHVRRVHFKDRVTCPKCTRKFYDTNLLGIHFPKCTGVIREGWRLNHRTEWAAMRQNIDKQKDNNGTTPSTATTSSGQKKPRGRGRGVYGAKIVNAFANVINENKNGTMSDPSTRSSLVNTSSTTTTRTKGQVKDYSKVEKNTCGKITSKATSTRAHLQLEQQKTAAEDDDGNSKEHESDAVAADDKTDDDDDVKWLPETLGKFGSFKSSQTLKKQLGTVKAVAVEDSSWSSALVSPPPLGNSVTFSMDPQDIEQMNVNLDNRSGGDDYDAADGTDDMDSYLESIPLIGKSAVVDFYSEDVIPLDGEFPVQTNFSNSSSADDQKNEIECIDIGDDDDDDDEGDPSFCDDDAEPLPPKLTKMQPETEIVTLVPKTSANDVLTKIRKAVKDADDEAGPFTTVQYECVFCDKPFDKEYLAIRHIRDDHKY